MQEISCFPVRVVEFGKRKSGFASVRFETPYSVKVGHGVHQQHFCSLKSSESDRSQRLQWTFIVARQPIAVRGDQVIDQ